jgi:hypothetical protein
MSSTDIDDPTKMSKVSTTRSFRLLDLPTDLTHRVLSFVNTESLTSVRRTCKALDAVTFDRFADERFAHTYCWNYTSSAFERLKDILQNAPRLRDRIRKVTLTDDFLEDQSIEALHLIHKENESEHYARIWAAQAYLNTRTERSTKLVLMHRILMDLQRLRQSISIAVDLTHHDINHRHPTFYTRSCETTIFAVTMSRTNIQSLAIDHSTFEHMDDIIEHNRADFIACLSTIQTLKATGDLWRWWPPHF